MGILQTGANALDTILAYKQEEVIALKAQTSIADLQEKAQAAPPVRGFAVALQSVVERGENGLICELKRKSPSAGEILPGADPVAIAQEYERGGAACLSILTDSPSFGGKISDLIAIRKGVSLPLLRKDFMIDPIQIVEARAMGADCILLIVAALSDDLAHEMAETALALDLDILMEVHTEEELARALNLPHTLLGVNNRNLKEMVTDIGNTGMLAAEIPKGHVAPLVSESGINTSEDIIALRKTGAQRFLIGESLMKSTSRETKVAALRSAK